MPLDRQTVIDDIRASNPELFEGWTDEKLYLLIRQQIPDLNVPGETPGAASYRAYGAQEVPGFMDRVSHQLETQLEETKVGLYGMMPWTETEAYENFRMYNRNLYRQKIADNVELQALTAWKEDEPGWTNLHTASRSLSEALPSLAINIVGTAAGIGLATATGGSSLMMTTATMAPIFAMEAGAQFNEAMSTLVDDVGLDPEEARGYAGITSLAYGSISTLLERIGAKHFLGLVGLREPGEQILKRTLAQRIVDAGVNSSKITRAGLRGSAGIAKTLEGALTEGVTETMQAYTQNTINKALELGLGEDDYTAKVALQKAFVETWDEKAVWEEGFAGATTGILGLPFGVGTRTQAGKVTSEEIAETIREERGEVVGTPVEDLKKEVPPEGPVSPTGVVSQYISAITGDDPTKVSDFIESIEEGTKDPVLKRILKADQTTTGIGKKLLMIVGSDKNLVDEIANSEFGDMLTSEMVKSIIDSEKIPAKMKGVDPQGKLEDKIDLLKNYAEYGLIQKGKIVEQGLGEPSQDDIELGVKPEYEDTLPFDKTGKPAIGDTEIPPGKDVAVRVGGKEIPIKPVIPKKITAKVMKDFVADGTVPQGVLQHIANKIEAGKKLTKNEETIRQGKSAEIETLLKEKVETPVPKDIEKAKKDLDNYINAISQQPKLLEEYKKDPIAFLEKEYNEAPDDVQKAFIAQAISAYKVLNEVKTTPSTPAVTPKAPLRPRTGRFAKLTDVQLENKYSELQTQRKNIVANIQAKGKGSTESIDKEIKRVTDELALRQAKPAAKEQLDKYLEPMDRVQFPTAKSREEQIAVVDGKEVKLTEEELNSLELFIEMDSSPVKIVKAQAQVMLLKIGRDLIEKHGKAEVKAKAKAEVPPETAEEPTAAPITGISTQRKMDIVLGKVALDDMTAKEQEWTDTDEANQIRAQLAAAVPKETAGAGDAAALKAAIAARKKVKADTTVSDENVSKPEKKITDRQKRREARNKRKADSSQKTRDTVEGKRKPKGTDENFQDLGDSNLPYIKDHPEFTARIAARLKKFFPDIEQAAVEGLIIKYGIERIGMATEALVMWSTTDGRIDTIPHEYAHIYIKMFRDQDIVKRGIKLFESEEALVKAMGEYFVDRMKNRPRSLRLRFEKWLKQFVARVKRMFHVEPKTKQEIMEFIAEEFYQGRWLGVTPAITIPFEEFMSKDPNQDSNENDTDTASGEEHEATGGESLNQTNTISSEDAYHSFWNEKFGIYLRKSGDYPRMVDIVLKKHKTFDEYLNDVYELLEEIVADRKWAQDESFKRREDLTDNDIRLIRREWTKLRQRNYRFSPTNKNRQGKDARLNFRIIRNYDLDTRTVLKGNNRTMGLEIADELDRVNNKLFPDSVMRNSIERDHQNNKHKIRLGILPMKQIIDRAFNRKDNSEWYKEASVNLTKDELDKMQDENDGRYVDKLIGQLNASLNSAKKKHENGVPVEEIKESLKQELMDTNAKLLVINGTKFGDNSAVIGSVVENINPHQMTPMMFKMAIDEELRIGNIRQEHYDIMVDESNLDELMAMDDDIINSTLSDYIDNWVNDNPNGKLSDLITEIKGLVEVLEKKTSLSASLHNLRFWQAVRTPDYFMYEKSASDTMIRLSIDMAEGQRPVELRDMKLMIVPKDYTVSGMIPVRDANGNVVKNRDGSPQMEPTEEIPYDLFDGASITGTEYLKLMADDIGYTKFQQIKTFIRHRALNKDTGETDYLGMKHMQFAGFKNMVLKDSDGNVVATMETNSTTKLTYWKEINSSQKFDMVASSNEAKMTFGGFASSEQKVKAFGGNLGDYKSGYGVIHTIPSSSIVINNVQEKSKNSASHPIALGELMLMLGYGNTYSDNVLKSIRTRYYDVVKYYTDKINGFYKDPKKFRDFVIRARDDGKIPSELEQYLEDIGNDGEGIWHPSIRTHLLPVVNSILIRDGLNKSRAWDGSSSILYIKPSFNSSEHPNQHVKEGHVILASDNKVAFNQVKKKWKESISEELYDRIMATRLTKHELIKTWLNPFLEQNDVKVLMHRNPISKVTGPVVRRVQSLEEGHGQSMLMTWKDVKEVFDGDWDGDKGAFEFVPDDYSSSMEEWQQYSIDNNIDKTASLPLFGPRVDDETNETDSTALSIFDSVDEIARNASNTGATGVVMNARTIMAELFSKNFTMDIESTDDSGNVTPITIKAADPNAEVIMDYIVVDKSMLNDNEIEILKANGDTLVDKDGNVIDFNKAKNSKIPIFLKTTKAHELVILFQMAVDGSKFTHLATILENLKDELGKPMSISNFINSRIFDKTVAGSPISIDFTNEELTTLGIVKGVQNFSSQRHGRTRTRISANLDINLAMSRELNSMFNGDEKLTENELKQPKVKGKLTDAQYSLAFTKKIRNEIANKKASWSGYRGIDDFIINLENNISPMESLLIGAGINLDYDLINAFQSENLLKNSHVAAVQAIMGSEIIEDYMYDMLSDSSKLDSYSKAEDFLYAQTEVLENGSTKLGELLNITKPSNMSLINIWNGLMEHTKDKEAIQSDKNLAFAEFIDRFIDKYQTLDNDAKMWITLKYLSGKTSGSTVYVNKLLPKIFLNNDIMKIFLPAYENHIRWAIANNKVDAPALEAREMRKKLRKPGGYFQMLEEVEDTMDKRRENTSNAKDKIGC